MASGPLPRVAAVYASRAGVLLALLLLVLLVVLPLLIVAAGSLWSAAFIRLPGEVTLDNYRSIVTDPHAVELLVTTLQMTLGSAVMAMVVGCALAWIIGRTDVPFRPLLWWLPVAPMLISGLVSNIGWIALYSPKTGLVNLALMRTFGLESPPFDIFSMAGVITSLGLHLAPIPYLIVIGPLTSLNRSLDEASSASGASAWRTLWHVTLPLLRPSLLGGLSLTAIIAAHAFETPVILGLPAGLHTYVSTIFESMAGLQNYSIASAQSMVYLALIAVLLWWNRRLTRVEARFALIAGRGHAPGLLRLGPWRWALGGVVLLAFTGSFAQLLAANVFISFLPYFSTSGELPPLSLDNYVSAATTATSVAAIKNSLILAAEAAVLTVAAATFLSFLAFKTRLAGRRLAEEIGTLPVAFPSLVFSMALLLTILSIPGLAILYNNVLLLVMVLVVVFLPYALRTVSATMIAIDNQLLEASASSGAGGFMTVRSIVLPLLATALTGALALVFVFSFRELGGIALVTPPSMNLLPTQIYSLWHLGSIGNVYALNVISFALTVLVLLLAAGVRAVIARRVGTGEAARAA